MDEGLLQEAAAELLGTFTVTFFAAAGLILDQAGSGGPLALAILGGVGYTVALTIIQDASRGHVNPAVTVAAWLTGRTSLQRAGAYVVAQGAGGLIAAVFVGALFPSAGATAAGHGATVVAEGVDVLSALAWELLLTFFLVLVFFATVLEDRDRTVAGIAVGAVAVLALLVGTGVTPASLNPARSLGPAALAGHWRLQWIYLVGPILGGALAGAVYDGVVKRAADVEAADAS